MLCAEQQKTKNGLRQQTIFESGHTAEQRQQQLQQLQQNLQRHQRQRRQLQQQQLQTMSFSLFFSSGLYPLGFLKDEENKAGFSFMLKLLWD